MYKLIDNFIPVFCIVSMFVLMGSCTHTLIKGDKYEKINAKYQCFQYGEQIYKSNNPPQFRGGNYWVGPEGKFQADDCLCMGCIGF